METGFITEESLSALMQGLTTEMENVPHLSERLLLDLVNGLHVNDDHLRCMDQQGRISRLLGAIDGSTRRRDLAMQHNQQEISRGLLGWVEELTLNSSITSKALEQTNDKLRSTREDLTAVAKHAVESRSLLREQASRIEAIEARINGEDGRLTRLEIDSLISKKKTAWVAGRMYQGYPLPVQATFFIDDVLRGERGDFIRREEQHEIYLRDAAVEGLRILGFQMGSEVRLEEILAMNRPGSPEKAEVAGWLLDLGPSAILHKALSATSTDTGIPSWVQNSIRDGDLRPSYSGNAFSRCIFNECADVRLN